MSRNFNKCVVKYKNEFNVPKGTYTMKRRILVLFTACILIFTTVFVSCSKKESATVFSYGTVSMHEKMYIFELTMMKSELLSGYGVVGQDVPEFWTADMGGGITFDDWFYTQCQMNICALLYFADYANANGGLTDDMQKGVDDSIDEIIEKMGSKKKVKAYLEDYGIDLDIYRDYLELYALYAKGVQLAYATGGIREIEKDRLLDYYEEKFITVKHVAVGTEIAGTDVEGNFVYYTDEEKAEKQQKIKDIRDKIASGADFDELYLTSEDKQAENYPDGYTLTSGVHTDDKKGYEEVALSLDIGEVGEWENEKFGHYFIKRVELNDADFQNCVNYIYPLVVEEDMMAAVLENYNEFFMDQDIIDSYNMASVPVLK